MVKHYFLIPFADKQDAKTLGGRWDPKAGQWYAASPCVHPAIWSRTGDMPACQAGKPWPTPTIKKVADIGMSEVDRRVGRAFALWHARSRHAWTLDLSIIINAGMRVVHPVPSG